MTRSKVDDFKKAMEEFITSDKDDVEDYMNMFYVFHRVTKQGSGLIFSDIEDIIKETLED